MIICGKWGSIKFKEIFGLMKISRNLEGLYMTLSKMPVLHSVRKSEWSKSICLMDLDVQIF